MCIDDFNNAFYAAIYDCIDNVPHSASSGSRRNIKRIYPRFARRIESKKTLSLKTRVTSFK